MVALVSLFLLSLCWCGPPKTGEPSGAGDAQPNQLERQAFFTNAGPSAGVYTSRFSSGPHQVTGCTSSSSSRTPDPGTDPETDGVHALTDQSTQIPGISVGAAHRCWGGRLLLNGRNPISWCGSACRRAE